MFSFPRGHELPALSPVTEKEQRRSNEEEEGEKGLTDAELLKQDVVKVRSYVAMQTELKLGKNCMR